MNSWLYRVHICRFSFCTYNVFFCDFDTFVELALHLFSKTNVASSVKISFNFCIILVCARSVHLWNSLHVHDAYHILYTLYFHQQKVNYLHNSALSPFLFQKAWLRCNLTNWRSCFRQSKTAIFVPLLTFRFSDDYKSTTNIKRIVASANRNIKDADSTSLKTHIWANPWLVTLHFGYLT